MFDPALLLGGDVTRDGQARIEEEVCKRHADRVGVLPAAALEARLAVAGSSGSGKTYATKGLVKRLLQGGARVCIVDRLGV